MFVLLFWVGRLLFQRRSHTESCSHGPAGIPNVSHGNVRNEKRNRTEFGGTKIRNKVPFPLRCGAFFTILRSQNRRQINVRNVPGDGALLIRLPRATCTAPPKHDEFTRVQTLVLWPADGAAFPWPAVRPKADSCTHPT